MKDESERIAKVEKSLEQSALIKPIIHKINTALSDDVMKGHAHHIMASLTLTLPPATVGLSGSFLAGVGASFSVKPRAEDRIILAGTELSAGSQITSDGYAGAMVSLVCLSPSQWQAIGITSLFFDGGK